ncbi:hypothetical protein MTR67_047464 [Solanum verrucosum]|uniref:Uncharacterized protein n=1 Tax=Solanum verrucosum TaxID=315347 RepID=A0AAF0ZZ22_SOLVR|nr:hypothetical protein MTR67_047464 [Solanum verrucosum]
MRSASSLCCGLDSGLVSQSQLIEFRSYEGQDMHTGEKVVPIKLDLQVNHTVIKDQFFWDMNNFEGDPEEFARTFCEDMKIEDPEVGVSSIYFLSVG